MLKVAYRLKGVLPILFASAVLSGCGGTTESTSSDQVTVPAPGSGSASANTPRQFLVSQMQNTAGNASLGITNEGGATFGFTNGNFDQGRLVWDYGEGIGPQNQNIQQRQSNGFQRANAGVATEVDNFGITVSAPDNGTMDISSATHIVLQTGNGRGAPGHGPISDNPNMHTSAISHMIYTVDLIAQVADSAADGGMRTVTCSADLALEEGDRNFNDEGVNPYAIHTFMIAIADFQDECADGGREEVLPRLSQVAVKLVGGKDAAASADQGTSDNSAVLLQVGWIGFISTDTSITADNSTNANKLFASQVMIADDGTARTIENGSVTLFSDSAFDIVAERFGTTAADKRTQIRERQAYGIERGSSATLSAESSFGITFNAANDGTVNISQSSILVIQMGNGSFSTNSFSVFTIELSDGTNWCRVNQDVSAAKSNSDAPPAGVHFYGLRTYELALSAFTACSSGAVGDVQTALSSVSVKVIAGEQANSDALYTNTLIHLGWVAFK